MRVDVVDAALRFGDRTVFEHFTASFPAGQVTALVGPSGSGKSSLLAAMSGYRRLDGGRVELHDDLPPEDVVGRPAAEPRAPDPSLVAWVPQGSNALGRRSVLDNVTLAPLATGADLSTARDIAVQALAVVGLADRLHATARRLSGGELQRVALARALASGKGLVLADEPSANLDAANTDQIAQVLHDLASAGSSGQITRATVIVATHDPVLVAAAHGAVHMRQHASPAPIGQVVTGAA